MDLMLFGETFFDEEIKREKHAKKKESYNAKVCAPEWFISADEPCNEPDVICYYQFRADLLYRKGRFQEALKEYDEVLVVLPKRNLPVLRNVQESRVRCLLHIDQPATDPVELATTLLKEAQNENQIANALMLLQHVHCFLGHVDEEISILQKCISLHHQSTDLWFKLAKAYMKLCSLESSCIMDDTACPRHKDNVKNNDSNACDSYNQQLLVHQEYHHDPKVQPGQKNTDLAASSYAVYNGSTSDCNRNQHTLPNGCAAKDNNSSVEEGDGSVAMENRLAVLNVGDDQMKDEESISIPKIAAGYRNVVEDVDGCSFVTKASLGKELTNEVTINGGLQDTCLKLERQEGVSLLSNENSGCGGSVHLCDKCSHNKSTEDCARLVGSDSHRQRVIGTGMPHYLVVFTCLLRARALLHQMCHNVSGLARDRYLRQEKEISMEIEKLSVKDDVFEIMRKSISHELSKYEESTSPVHASQDSNDFREKFEKFWFSWHKDSVNINCTDAD